MDVRAFVKDRHAFYEIAPYYVIVDEGQRGVQAPRKVQAGFDVDVYGVGPEDSGLAMPPRHEYAVAYGVLRQLAADVLREAGSGCSLEVIPFPARVVLDPHGYGKVKAVLRIRVSHFRGLDQPAGAPELRAVEAVREHLEALGVAHR